MKTIQPMLVVAFIAFASTVFGEDCNLEIRDGFAAQDLSRILHCLDKRIKNNEIDINEIKSTIKFTEKTTPKTVFDTGKLTATTRGNSKKDRCINVGLSLKNNTTEEILVATETGKSVLIDEETGVSLKIDDQSGLAYNHDEEKNSRMYSPILPNAQINYNMSFCNDDFVKSHSRLFSLNLSLLTLNNDKVDKTTVPLSVTLKTN